MEKKTLSSVLYLKNPHFFKTLRPGFNNYMKIPVKFLSKYIEGIQEAKSVNLKSDFSNRTWKVKMEDNTLTKGWKEFVEAHELRIGDFVFFRYEGDMLFNVTVLGPNGCEIQYEQSQSNEESHESEISSRSEKEFETEPDQVSSHLSCFRQTVTASNLSRNQVTVPKTFAMLNGFLNKEMQEILLMNEEGKTWESEVKTYEASRLKIVRGWRSFCTANKLEIGDSCIFRLVRDKGTVVFELCSRSNAEKNRIMFLSKMEQSSSEAEGTPHKRARVEKMSQESRLKHDVGKKISEKGESSHPLLKFVSKMERSSSEGRPHKSARVERMNQDSRLKHGVREKIAEEGESSRPLLKFVSKMQQSSSEAEAKSHKRARVEKSSSRCNSAGDQGNLQTQIPSILDNLAKEEKKVKERLTSIRLIRANLVTEEDNLEALFSEMEN